MSQDSADELNGVSPPANDRGGDTVVLARLRAILEPLVYKGQYGRDICKDSLVV